MALEATRADRRAHKTDQRDAGINYRKWSQVQHGIRELETMETRSNTKDVRSFFNLKDSVPEYLTLYNKYDVYENYKTIDPEPLLAEIVHTLTRPRSTFMQIKLMRELLYRAGAFLILQRKLIDDMIVERNRLTENVGERGRKRWTQQDDELLIEMASQDDTTIIDLSRQFGRTPGAIQSRISKLVGIKKMSVEVAGRFIGTLNGEFVEGNIDGTVSKGVR